MTLPSSCTTARLAVINALTVDCSPTPRAIPSAYLFKTATPAEAAQNPADIKKQPRAFVLFRDARLDGEMENGSSLTVHYTVQITCWYWLGSDLVKTEVATHLARAEADQHRLRAALCYPGALASFTGTSAGVTYTAADTGLCGHALRADGYHAAGPVTLPTQGTDAQRILKVDHFFTASIDQLQPT